MTCVLDLKNYRRFLCVAAGHYTDVTLTTT